MINTEFTFIVNPVCTGTIQIQIDPDNAIAETDKVNNRMTKEFPKTW
jgi:subtilase family serine protease